MFVDRKDAGAQLASRILNQHYDTRDMIVLALPRGGVPVAHPIANALHVPLDVFLVRKIGAPHNDEYALGAIASGDVLYLNHDAMAQHGVSRVALQTIIDREKAELARREAVYRQGKDALDLANHTIILVDDGIATGATIHAAIMAIRQHQPKRIILAVPVASPDSIDVLAPLVDKVHVLLRPNLLSSVGEWYEHFDQTTDEEVLSLLLKE